MSNEDDQDNEFIAYIHHIPLLPENPFEDEPMSDEDSDEDECSCDEEELIYDPHTGLYYEKDFEPLREDDVFVMMQMIQSNGTAACLPLTVKSCGALNTQSYSSRPASARSLRSWSGDDPLHGLQGRLYRFYSPQYGHSQLKRCVSETEINILRSQSCLCEFSSDEFSYYSPGSVNVSLMDDSNSDSLYDNVDDYFNYQMDELTEMFENLHIDTCTPFRRVHKIFNLKTWTGAIYEEPGTSQEEARLLPLERAWQFVEFNRNPPSTPGKRYADWYTTDHLPEEKKRKDRNI